MKVTIDIPADFVKHFENDRFEDSLRRIIIDLDDAIEFESSISGLYETELCKMLIEAFKTATIIDFCQCNITPLKAYHQSVAVSALQRVIEASKEYCIEADPVKHGQWIHHAGMNSKCSCCGTYFPVAEFEQRPFDVNFCIHCGAKMDGVAD